MAMMMHLFGFSPSSIHVANALSNLFELTHYAPEWHYDRRGTITIAIMFEKKNQTSNMFVKA